VTDERGDSLGRIGWVDLTVAEAGELRDFYGEVVGWRAVPVDMGGYEDFNMMPPGSDAPVAGVCHARGTNAELPACWMVYVTVADLDRSLARCLELGGEVVAGPKSAGSLGRYAIVRDPSGAAFGLFEQG
jgi:predicted enzyme related to lactoylglutathione lyase